jgi:hypothetical protein
VLDASRIANVRYRLARGEHYCDQIVRHGAAKVSASIPHKHLAKRNDAC